MYSVCFGNTEENREYIRSLGIRDSHIKPIDTPFVSVQLYVRAMTYNSHAHIDCPVIPIEHLAPILLINNPKQALIYAMEEGLLTKEHIDRMAIVPEHRP